MLPGAGSSLDHGFKSFLQISRSWNVWSSAVVFSVSGKLLGWLAAAALGLIGLGLAVGLPVDVPVGFVRTGLIHLPVAWLSILLLIVVAFWAALGLVTDKPLPFMMAQALAPTGGMFAFLALWSGAQWNKASVGVWWVGGAREVAEVTALLMYLFMISIPVLVEDLRRADRLTGMLALLAALQVPLLYFVVELLGGVGVSPTPILKGAALWADRRELVALFLLAAGFWLYATFASLLRLRCIIVEREAGVVNPVGLDRPF